jgi:hypothetical protein
MCKASNSYDNVANTTVYKSCWEELKRRGVRKNQAIKAELRRNGGCMVDTNKEAMLVSKL